MQALNKFQQEVGGPMRQSQPGVVLIKPADGVAAPTYFTDVPKAYHPQKGRLIVLPTWHIFGSDELSALSPGVKELSPQPYLAIGAADAHCLGLAEGDGLTISLPGLTVLLPVRIRKELHSGIALLPVGLPGVPFVQLPAWAEIVAPAGAAPAGQSGGAAT